MTVSNYCFIYPDFVSALSLRFKLKVKHMRPQCSDTGIIARDRQTGSLNKYTTYLIKYKQEIFLLYLQCNAQIKSMNQCRIVCPFEGGNEDGTILC